MAGHQERVRPSCARTDLNRGQRVRTARSGSAAVTEARSTCSPGLGTDRPARRRTHGDARSPPRRPPAETIPSARPADAATTPLGPAQRGSRPPTCVRAHQTPPGRYWPPSPHTTTDPTHRIGHASRDESPAPRGQLNRKLRPFGMALPPFDRRTVDTSADDANKRMPARRRAPFAFWRRPKTPPHQLARSSSHDNQDFSPLFAHYLRRST
jgi:hypothetical protein